MTKTLAGVDEALRWSDGNSSEYCRQNEKATKEVSHLGDSVSVDPEADLPTISEKKD